MKLIYTSLCCCFFLGLMACGNENTTHTTEATLRWTGPVAADGCGFFLDIEGQEYKPANEEVIPDAFKSEGAQPVQLTYQELEEPVVYTCGMLPSRYSSTIRILEVRPL